MKQVNSTLGNLQEFLCSRWHQNRIDFIVTALNPIRKWKIKLPGSGIYIKKIEYFPLENNFKHLLSKQRCGFMGGLVMFHHLVKLKQV